ncbi:MAG: Transcriptional regulator PadR-like family protein [Candidatus Lokiarchaeum sp. GC14_75]|nr:MAG: Transcriptional regulator PadR-like family protein [Candidatus Lokiarchaeum sp. GC14_75]
MIEKHEDHEDHVEIKVQNLTRFYTLVLIRSKSPITGYYILKRLKEDLGKTSSPTYVYDFLKSLKREGYLEDAKASNSKRSQGYKLTPAGEIFTENIFSRFNNMIETAIQSKIKICASCGVKLYDSVHIEEIRGVELNFCCKHCAKAYKSQISA